MFLELWLSKHYDEIINYMRPIIDSYLGGKYVGKTITKKQLLLERPINGGKTVDALILLNMGTETKGNDITLIIDIKPSLQRLSAAQSQINTYENILGKTTSNGYTIYRGRTKIIITMDERTIFNEMLYNQNIYVIFVPRDIVYSDKPLPRSSYGRRLGRGLTVKLSRVTR